MEGIKLKNFSLELEIIEQFESLKNQKVIIENCEGEAFINKSNRDFNLTFNGIFKYKADKKIKVKLENTDYIFQSIDFKEPINEVFSKIVTQHTFDIDKVYKGTFNNEALFKMYNTLEKLGPLFKLKLLTLNSRKKHEKNEKKI